MTLFDLPARRRRCVDCQHWLTVPAPPERRLPDGEEIGPDCAEKRGIVPPASPRIASRKSGPVKDQIDLLNEGEEMTTLDDRPVPQVRLDMEALDEAAKLAPLYLVDCDDELQIWRESALENVHRDESGEIVGFRTPGCYKATDLVAEWDLDGWDEDEGDTTDDDIRRKAAEAFVTAINSLPAQLEAGRNLGKTIDMFAEVMRSAIRQSRAKGAEAGMAVILDFAEEMPELLEGLDEPGGADMAGAGRG